MSAANFDRKFELVLSKPTGFFGQSASNTVVIRDLKVRFKVDKTLDAKPNTATVEIFNLNPVSTAVFQKRPLHVRLSVGYARDAQLNRVIEGDMISAVPSRSGPDSIMLLNLGSGERAFVEARTSAVFGKGVDKRTLVKQIASDMGLSIPTSIESAKALLRQYSDGISMKGSSQELLSKQLKGTGLQWSIQDDKLQILDSKDTLKGQVEVISPATGLLDSPVYAPSTAPGTPPILKCKLLLRPQIIPGVRVKVESKDFSGFYKVLKVGHSGDTRENDWYTQIDAAPL